MQNPKVDAVAKPKRKVYEQSFENGRMVLQNRKVKLIQIIDTEEDRKLYKENFDDYATFVAKKLNQQKMDGDIDAIFEEEVLHPNHEKFPFFFAYSKTNNKFLGTFGYSRCYKCLVDGKEQEFQEITTRLSSKFIGSLQLYAKNILDILFGYVQDKKQPYLTTTYEFHRNLILHGCEVYKMYWLKQFQFKKFPVLPAIKFDLCASNQLDFDSFLNSLESSHS